MAKAKAKQPKLVPGETKFNDPTTNVKRVYLGPDAATGGHKFQTYSDEKGRGVGRPMIRESIPEGWVSAA